MTIIPNHSGNNRKDELTFNYNTCSNQLDYISDAYSSSLTEDLENQSTGAYQYNDIGDATVSESNQGAVTVTYDSYGMVTCIKESANDKNKIEFTYDDKGARLSKKIYEDVSGTSTAVATYWYTNDPSGNNLAIYYIDETATTPVLELIEQAVNGTSQEATYYESTGDYVYRISDHLGNVRAVLDQDKDVNGDAVLLASADYYPLLVVV